MKFSLIVSGLLITMSLSAQSDSDSLVPNKQKGEPFDNADMTWANGSDRRTSNIWKNMKYFTPSVLVDVNYTYSFNNPNDTGDPI